MQNKLQKDASFRHESLQDADSIRELLEAVTNGLAKGKLSFSDGEGEIQMEPKGLLRLKLTANRQDNQQRVSIRISWQVEDKPQKKQKSLTVR